MKLTRSELIGSGYKYVIFGPGEPFTQDINGKVFWLGTGCTNCDTWIAGDANYSHCPNCRKQIAYVTEAAEPHGPEITD